MRVCPDCPIHDRYGNPQDPRPSRDQRPWAQDGRCLGCHDTLRIAASERRADKRAKFRRLAPRRVNWAQV